MCLVKTPKIDKEAARQKDPAVIRNPYLDGDPTMKALRLGRSALRIERTGVAGSTPPPVSAPRVARDRPVGDGGNSPIGAIDRDPVAALHRAMAGPLRRTI